MKIFICFVVFAVVKGFPHPANSLTQDPEPTIPQEIHILPPSPIGDNLMDYVQVKDINQPQDIRGGSTADDQNEEIDSADIEELNDDILSAIKLAAALRFDVLRNFALNDNEVNLANEIEALSNKVLFDSSDSKNEADSEIGDPIDVKIVNHVE